MDKLTNKEVLDQVDGYSIKESFTGTTVVRSSEIGYVEFSGTEREREARARLFIAVDSYCRGSGEFDASTADELTKDFLFIQE